MDNKCYAFYESEKICLLFGKACKADKSINCYHQSKIQAENKKLIPGRHFNSTK
ncbi:MAG: hypothetical protein GY756_22870 [bacterium]|nr:hypothetical protein [bacterium]